jgi:uncharacterized protein Yka (UPF0111/DUF47 family)
LAFRLIPREEKFFADFLAMADELRKGARLLEEMLAVDKPVWDKADEIKEVEHKCDFLTHEIIQRLNRTFVTPIDREDIHELARSLDDVMDAIDASAAVVRLYRLDSVRFGARELARPKADRLQPVETHERGRRVNRIHDIVERTSELVDVLAVDRRDERPIEALDDLVGEEVALVLDFLDFVGLVPDGPIGSEHLLEQAGANAEFVGKGQKIAVELLLARNQAESHSPP